MKKFCAFVLVAACGSGAFAQVSTIDGLNSSATRWFNDLPGSNLTVTNNGLAGIRYQETNTATNGFANRHYAALSAGGVPYSFGAAESWQLTVDATINGPLGSEAGIQIGTTPFFPSSFGADVGNFVLLPNNGGEIAAFGGQMPFFSNNQVENAGMARSAIGTTYRMQVIYVGTADGGPFVKYGINGVFTAPQNSGGTFTGWNAGTTVGFYTQNNFAFAAGQADVQFNNISIIGIPAPASAGLLGLGGLVALRRRR
jgi:hypothetical protein